MPERASAEEQKGLRGNQKKGRGKADVLQRLSKLYNMADPCPIHFHSSIVAVCYGVENKGSCWCLFILMLVHTRGFSVSVCVCVCVCVSVCVFVCQKEGWWSDSVVSTSNDHIGQV